LVAKAQNPNIPEQPEEIAASAYDCYNEGAAIVHLHARDQEGNLSGDPKIYRTIHEKIRAKCDVIIQDTTGAGPHLTLDQRLASLEADPEMASLNMGTMVRLLELYKGTLQFNPPWEIERFAKAMLENKIKVINDLKVRQKDAVLMMDKLSRSLPDWVWLTNLSFSNQVLTLNGKALSNNLIADFINNLQNSNYFLNVQLRTSVRKREAGTDIFEFRLLTGAALVSERAARMKLATRRQFDQIGRNTVPDPPAKEGLPAFRTGEHQRHAERKHLPLSTAQHSPLQVTARLQSREDGQFLPLRMPDKDLIEEAVPLDGWLEPWLAPRSAERRCIDAFHVTPESIVDCLHCI
jgi:hypothetical protein